MNNESYKVDPVGYIITPYIKGEEIPIQGTFDKDTVAHIELLDKYVPGLKDLDGFSHAILIYRFDRADHFSLTGRPFLEDQEHGIFATRSPFRPNHIGISVVKIEEIRDNKLFFSEADMLDNTPLLDIKPYVKYFDQRDNTIAGWVEKHFSDEKNIPVNRLKNKI